MSAKRTGMLAGIAGFTAVAMGAFGGHTFKDKLTELGTTSTWETGSDYHLAHAVAILALAIWSRLEPANRSIGKVAVLWCIGIVLFSGSLYGLALGGPRWLGPITPLGGLSYMAGWVWIALVLKKAKA